MSSSPCNINENDYEESKKIFLKLVEKNLGSSKLYSKVYQLHTKQRTEQITTEKLANPSIHQRFKVITTDDGKNILFREKKGKYLEVLSWEDIFDKFKPLHDRCGHRGPYFLKKEILAYSRNLGVQYKFPIVCLNYFTRACYTCGQHKDAEFLSNQLTTGLVYVMAMTQTREMEKFRYLLIYVDKETHYTILRPLTEKSSMEISVELFKIFTQFSPPDALHVHSYNPSLTDQIRNMLNEICPEFNIDMEHQPAQYELPSVVIDRIQEWMTKTKSPVWEVGCFIVQAEMNNDPKIRPIRKSVLPHYTPHILYFHTQLEQTPDSKSLIELMDQVHQDTEMLAQNETAVKEETTISNGDNKSQPSRNEGNDQDDESVIVLDSDEEISLDSSSSDSLE